MSRDGGGRQALIARDKGIMSLMSLENLRIRWNKATKKLQRTAQTPFLKSQSLNAKTQAAAQAGKPPTMFSVVIPGRPCQTDIVAIDPQPNGQATKFAFTIPMSPPFNEIVIFFLPGTVLPPNTGAAIYAQLPDPATGSPTDFRFIGALANEKPSGIFKVQSSPASKNPNARSEDEEEDEMLDEGGTVTGVMTLGISIEPVQNIAPQLAALENESAVGSAQKQISTKVLAQRIIGSAFNFLASFAESDKGRDVVPLKSFRDWWTKFERRIEMDPSFLEKADPNET